MIHRSLGYRSQANPLEEIKKILITGSHSDEEYYIFGSRARGDSDQRSDYDVLITTKSGKKLSLFRTIRLQSQCNEELPWHVDIVDFTRASEQFQSIIKKDMIRL